MSRLYEMQVNIEEYNKDREWEIQEAANDAWNFGDDWYTGNDYMSAHGQANLCGGEGEDEFARRLANEIWKANGGYCKVEVVATYLEDLPFERYELGEEDYNKVKDILKIGENNG